MERNLKISIILFVFDICKFFICLLFGIRMFSGMYSIIVGLYLFLVYYIGINIVLDFIDINSKLYLIFRFFFYYD